MRAWEWSGDELLEALAAPVEPDVAGSLVVVTSPPGRVAGSLRTAVSRLATLPSVVVAGPGHDPTPEELAVVDLVAESVDELDDLAAAVDRSPVAAQATALLLRPSERRSVQDGLAAESAVFSTLQSGPEHRAWRERTPRRRRQEADAPRVHLERRGDLVEIVLRRPDAANALDTRMRDELLEALAVVEADPGLHAVVRGEGPAFCAGGDLDEFGTAPDPASAHLVRLRRSIGAVLARVADRVTVVVEGAAAGSGVELAAFAGRVVAGPDARFVLPELRLGLVPGAGGTVSLPRRIGRHRTAWMALTGREVDATTARSWGLADEIALF